MAENVPSEETHVLQTCSGSRKQYLRGKVPVPKTTLWRSGYRKQLRSYKANTTKERKLYFRDPSMPVLRQTLYNWRVAQKESSVQSVVEVPEVHLGASVDGDSHAGKEDSLIAVLTMWV